MESNLAKFSLVCLFTYRTVGNIVCIPDTQFDTKCTQNWEGKITHKMIHLENEISPIKRIGET